MIPAALRERLLANGRETASGRTRDFYPVVKLFTPDANATWLLSEIDPDEPDHAFGLCDLGHSSPELGYVSLSELAAVRGRFGLPVQIDRHFLARRSISEYAQDARVLGRIVA